MTTYRKVIPVTAAQMLRAGGTVVRALSSPLCAETSVTCNVDHNQQAHASRSGVGRSSSAQGDEMRANSVPKTLFFIWHKTVDVGYKEHNQV